ncbi:MAG TPA: hypothetical protein VGF45_15505, partial [Polyangia bacterium]
MKPRPDPSATTPLSLAITGLDDNGAGIAAQDELMVHVARALPGEQITAALTHTSPHRKADGRRDAWGELQAIAVSSPDRVAPVCAAYGRCGGCVLQHLAPAAQAAWKRSRVEAALAEVLRGAGDGGKPVEVSPCVPSPQSLGYRNQAKYVVGRAANGRPILGAFAPRSHDVVDLAGCRLGEAPQDAIATWLRDWLETHAVPPD